MDRLTFEGNFCDIAMCRETPGGSFCEDGYCSQRKVWERLKAYEDMGLDPETIKGILDAINGGLSAENGIWCPKCGDALDIDIVNGVLAIDCFGCDEYTPVSELMRLYTDDVVPIPTVAQWLGRDDFCSYGERKESNE